MSETPDTSIGRVAAALVCDFHRSPIGTRSRLLEKLHGETVFLRTLQRLAAVDGLDEIVLLVPAAQLEIARSLQLPSLRLPLQILEMRQRDAALDRRVRTCRAWDLVSWRGGAGQLTVFDEDYHPAAIYAALQAAHAAHILVVPAHAPFLDAHLTTQLIHHHLHKNHEMRFTYTPAAPGITGIILQASIVAEMAVQNVLPGQLLGYDANAPTFDTLIRDACMQVDPALSKIQNRFLVDTDRSFQLAQRLFTQTQDSPAALARDARELLLCSLQSSNEISNPRELEIELTPQRITAPPGSLRADRTPLTVTAWQQWLEQQTFPDDLLITLAGDGDPLLFPHLFEILRLLRAKNPLSIHVQTDLASDITPLLNALSEDLLDVISVHFYGHDAPTYAAVAQADLYPIVMANMQTLADATCTNPRGTGLPLVIPRLLKVRDTIPQLEPFFDTWTRACGWAVIDYPTDRAGTLPFAGVVDMAPSKRHPCRRLSDRFILRADGTAIACDQDTQGLLRFGTMATLTLQQLWTSPSACSLRTQHSAGKWNNIDPCKSCREWHRA